jgi:class 3 adenylate cyclase
MTADELKTKVEEIEALLKTRNDYALVETQARELLEVLSIGEGTGGDRELYCRILLALSESLWQRGLAKDALPYAEQALNLAEQIESKELQAKALGYIGTVHSDLSDYSLALEYLGKALSLAEALDNKAGMATYLSNIGIVHLEHSDYALALEYYGKALALDEELGNKAGMAACLGNIGNVYANLSDYARALEYLGRALSLNEELDRKAGVAIQFGNIGVVHGQLSDYVRALEYFGKALTLDEELGNKALVASWLGNIGTVHYSLSNFSLALEYYGKALALHEELGDKVGVANWLSGVGTVHRNFSDYASALEYYGKALAFAEELGNKALVADNLGNIGETYTKHDFDGYDPAKAEEFLQRAIAMNEELGTKGQNLKVFKGLSELYATSERWKESREQFEKYHNLEKEVQSEDAHKQANLMEQRRQAAEREKEIEIERTRATAEKRILNNILPEEITQRLIKGENPIADTFDSVSVLFMDIVDFTKLSTTISAQQLVHLLNAIFTAADGVMREFGLEKIKTIGDAYMAVAGAPIVQEDHAQRAANAALKLLEVMENLEVSFPPEYGDRSWIESIPEIQVRIGLHCGPAAAGVVGENKFLYDLWGDAVNTASRMESHGAAGKIHVSDDFCIAVETMHAASLRFIPRGDMEIKGKGMMKTYFLEKE